MYFCNDDKELQDLIYDKDNRLKRSFVDFFIGGKKKPLNSERQLKMALAALCITPQQMQHALRTFSAASLLCIDWERVNETLE